MKEIIRDTGIFRRITRRMETPDDVEEIVQDWRDDHNVKKRLGDVAKTLQEIVAAYRDTNAKTFQVIKGKRYKFGHIHGDLANDAPPEAFIARDALELLDDLNALIAQKMIDRAVIAAYELGFTCCQIGATQHEPTIQGRRKANEKKTEDAKTARPIIRERFLAIYNRGVHATQQAVIDEMLDDPWLVKPSNADSHGMRMPRRTTLENNTRGLIPAKKSRRRTSNR